MKEIKAPLEIRYKELKITATCENRNCHAGFELEGEDIRIHRRGDALSYCGGPSLSFLCPHCSHITYVDLEDSELEEYIQANFPPVYYNNDL